MANVSDYVKNYGNISFEEKPFCDEDNVALGMSFYMPLEKVVSPSFDDEPIPFDVACKELFAIRGNKHKAIGLILFKRISRLFMDMAEQTRYREMRVVACTDNFSKVPAIQFNAGTFLLHDGEIAVVFRGTDDSLAGWKEDLDIIGGADDIPSAKLAVEYLAEVARRFDGDIIVSGHSKGGHIAQYAVLNSSKEVRDRIRLFYNNDGPGFKSYDYLESDAYKEMLPRYRHFVPRSAFVGVMLFHDDDYTVIKCSDKTGVTQHDMLTWQFSGDKLQTCDDITAVSKITDLVFYELIRNHTKEQIDALETAVGEIFEATGHSRLLDIKNNLAQSLKSANSAYQDLDDETRALLSEISKNISTYIKNAARAVRKGEYKSVRERLNN